MRTLTPASAPPPLRIDAICRWSNATRAFRSATFCAPYVPSFSTTWRASEFAAIRAFRPVGACTVIRTIGFVWTRVVPTLAVGLDTDCVEIFPRSCAGFIPAAAAAASIASSDRAIVATLVGFVCCDWSGVLPG